ncbi:MAG: hypothetical protein J2P50_20685 [Hyphomicrobiaceae bacterium]|nr:hypothetical protein [Hyphomicrobiaceae bacterium]
MALLLLTGGCAGGFGAPSTEALKTMAQAKTVGVISTVGDKFALQKMGLTVFGNELNEVAINSWGIDNAVANKVSALLSKRYTVRRVSYSGGGPDAGVEDILRKVAASQKCDLYVVVARSTAPVGSSNQSVSGLGMIEVGGVLNPDNVTLFAVTAVSVYDGRTFESLGAQRTGFEGLSFTKTINAPTRTLDHSWWPATPQAVHNEKLKAATRALVEQGLATTVPQIMGLTKAAAAN